MTTTLSFKQPIPFDDTFLRFHFDFQETNHEVIEQDPFAELDEIINLGLDDPEDYLDL